MIISPSYSSRKIYLIAKTFCRTPAVHCLCQVQKVQRFSRFPFVRLGHAATVRPGALHAASSPWPAPRTHAWPIPGIGSNEPRRRWKLLRWLRLPWRPARARARSPRHPVPPNIPWLSACPCHASARPWHRRRGPASTECAPCRRRARAARSVELAQSTQSKLG